MSTNSAVMVYLPLGAADSVTAFTGTTSAAIALPTKATRVWLVATEGCSVIFGSSTVAAAVVATCMPLQEDTDYIFDVPVGITHFCVIRSGSTSGSLYVAAVA